MTDGPRYRAGGSIEDVCRVCKTVRLHTVMATDGAGRPLRVVCDYCRSEHNYRGGGSGDGGSAASGGGRPARPRLRTTPAEPEPLPMVGARERTGPAMATNETGGDLELLLRRILREEMGLTRAVPAEKWRGGELVLRPGRPG